MTDGHKLDKNHIFSVCRFSEFRYVNGRWYVDGRYTDARAHTHTHTHIRTYRLIEVCQKAFSAKIE